MTISGRARVAGVIGDPVVQSLSPRLHAHWLAAHGIDGAYVPLAVGREHFARVVDGLRAAGFVGLNVTVPHKEAAFAIAEQLDDGARMTGAVNLLVFHRGRVEGRNTDITGLAESLKAELGAEWLQGKATVVLGAGGAARAALLALGNLRAGEVRLLARDRRRADGVVQDIKGATPARLRSFGWPDWPEAAAHVALLVNATSAGMKGKPPLDLSLDPLPREAVVCDVVYNPLQTPLLAAGRARGHRTIDGLGMLMHQAVPSFEAFYGVKPLVTPALRSELEGALA